MSGQAARPLARRILGQGSLVMGGFAVAQACSFARNAVLGHLLSKGDFGVAATLTLMLQLLEMSTDIAADRFIVQAADGDDERVQASAHTAMLIRAVLLAALAVVAAPYVAAFFHIPEAETGFQLLAVVLMIKGFTHLDFRRHQRHLDNRAALAVEVIPQVLALALTVPVVRSVGGWHAVAVLLLLQAVLTVAISHMLATRRWRTSADRTLFRRLVVFGWPVWLSAIPLMIVYQGERAIVGRFFGIEALAGYTAAFMITMVPALVASRVASSLLLPMLSQVQHDRPRFVARLAITMEITALLTSAYAAAFIVMGGLVLKASFGPSYDGLGALVAVLTAMWAARMLVAVPGTVLMALGDTRGYPVIGIVRALALIPAVGLALMGADLSIVAASGLAGEALSLPCAAFFVRRLEQRAVVHILRSSLILLTAFGLGAGARILMADGAGAIETIALAAAASAAALGLGLLIAPNVTAEISARLRLSPKAAR